MLHGLEAVIIPQKDLILLGRAFLQIFPELQALRKDTKSAAVYLLMGMVPIEAELHYQILGLLGAMTRMDPDSP